MPDSATSTPATAKYLFEPRSLIDLMPIPANSSSALAGLTPAHDEVLAGIGIKSVRDLGSNKYFAVAGVLVALSGKTG